MVGSAPAPQPLSTGQPADVLDIVLTPSVADDLDIAVGDVVFLVDPTAEPIAVRLTGLVEPINAPTTIRSGPAWAARSSPGTNPATRTICTAGLRWCPRCAYDTMARLDSLGLDTRLRYPSASPDRLRDDDVPALRAELQTARTQGIPGAVPLPGTSFLTSRLTLLSGLDPLFEQHLDQRRAARGQRRPGREPARARRGGAVARGPSGGGPPGRGVVDRARAGSRDAAGRALAHNRAGEIVAVPAVVAGAVIARWLVPGEDDAVSWWLAVLVPATALVSLPAVAWHRLHAVSSSVAAARGRTSRFGSSARRWSGELLLVALAGLAVFAVSRRGISSQAAQTGGDPVCRTGPVVGAAGGGGDRAAALPASAARVGEQACPAAATWCRSWRSQARPGASASWRCRCW